MVAAAGAVWPTPPAIDSASEPTAAVVEVTQPASEQTAQLSNGSDLSGKWSMFSYLLMIVSGILAVMSALWLLPRMRVRAKPEVADEEELAASPYTSN